MNNTALAGIVVGNPIVFIFDEHPCAVGCRRDCRFPFSSTNDFDAAMINGYFTNPFLAFLADSFVDFSLGMIWVLSYNESRPITTVCMWGDERERSYSVI